MPRTKYARKPQMEGQSLEETDLLVRDFERQSQLRIRNMEAENKMVLKRLETSVDLALSRIPARIRQVTMGELRNNDAYSEKENYQEVSSSVDDFTLPLKPATVKSKKTTKRITTTSDDGYVTEGIGTGSHVSRATKTSEASSRRTRSSSRNSRAKLSEIPNSALLKVVDKSIKTGKTDKFKTPAARKPNNNEYGLVTPKIKPNTPMNVLRRPRQGEMVLSMQGSPLLVSAVVQEETANINVPLKNGSVISFLPKEGLRMSHIPSLDAETMQQLATLKNHIEKVINVKK